MAYSSGKLLRIKIGNGASPETFTAIGGARQESFTLNNGTIDISNKDEDDWRQILDGAGVRQASLSISGIFGDSASETTLRTAAAAGDVRNYQPSGDEVPGGRGRMAGVKRTRRLHTVAEQCAQVVASPEPGAVRQNQ